MFILTFEMQNDLLPNHDRETFLYFGKVPKVLESHQWNLWIPVGMVNFRIHSPDTAWGNFASISSALGVLARKRQLLPRLDGVNVELVFKTVDYEK